MSLLYYTIKLTRLQDACANMPQFRKRLFVQYLADCSGIPDPHAVGVVEAASSSLVTQTKIGGSIEPPIFFYFLAKSLEISRFRNKHNGIVLPYFEG